MKSVLGKGAECELTYTSSKVKGKGKECIASVEVLANRGSSIDTHSSAATVVLFSKESKVLQDAGVDSVHLQGVLHDKFHKHNFANIPAILYSPLFENACNFTIWITLVASSGPVIPGRYIQLPTGQILPNGDVWGKIESYRAALVLSLLDSYSIFPEWDSGSAIIQAFAGTMRVPIRGMINSYENKKWWEEYRDWRATRGIDAVEYTAAIAPTRVQTRKGATNTLTGIWAAHLAELQTVSVLPKSPLRPSTEAD